MSTPADPFAAALNDVADAVLRYLVFKDTIAQNSLRVSERAMASLPDAEQSVVAACRALIRADDVRAAAKLPEAYRK